jgi:hypothetical protein
VRERGVIRLGERGRVRDWKGGKAISGKRGRLTVGNGKG